MVRRLGAIACAALLSVSLFSVFDVRSKAALSDLDVVDWAQIAADAGYEVIDTHAELLDNYCDDLYVLYLGACKNGKIAEALVAAWLRTGAFSFETSTSGLPVMKGILEAGELVKSKIDDESFSPFYLEYLDGTVDEEVTSQDVAVVSGEVFNDVVERLNQQYGPEQKADRRLVSLQNPIHSSYDVAGFGWSNLSTNTNQSRNCIPIRLGSDLLLGQDYSEYWFFPFIDDDDNGMVYYSSYQYRIYHNVVTNDDGTNTVSLMADAYSCVDDTAEVVTYTLVDDLGSYPYVFVKMGYPQGTSNEAIFGAFAFSDNINFLKFSAVRQKGYIDKVDVISSDNIVFSTMTTLVGADTFDPVDDGDDVGFITSSTKFNIGFLTTPLPDVTDNYYITINGDNIYDYSITNPDTGESSTINYYITNNYTFPDNGSGDDDGGESGGSTSGDVNVGGNVNVSGDIDVGGKVDINVDVNINDNTSSGSTESQPSYIDGEDINLDEYIEKTPEIANGFTSYMKRVMSWLPADILGVMILGVVVAVWCRLAGR